MRKKILAEINSMYKNKRSLTNEQISEKLSKLSAVAALLGSSDPRPEIMAFASLIEARSNKLYGKDFPANSKTVFSEDHEKVVDHINDLADIFERDELDIPAALKAVTDASICLMLISSKIIGLALGNTPGVVEDDEDKQIGDGSEGAPTASTPPVVAAVPPVSGGDQSYKMTPEMEKTVKEAADAVNEANKSAGDIVGEFAVGIENG